MPVPRRKSTPLPLPSDAFAFDAEDAMFSSSQQINELGAGGGGGACARGRMHAHGAQGFSGGRDGVGRGALGRQGLARGTLAKTPGQGGRRSGMGWVRVLVLVWAWLGTVWARAR